MLCVDSKVVDRAESHIWIPSGEVVINDEFFTEIQETISMQQLQQTADPSQKRYQTPAPDSLMQPHRADMTARKGPVLKVVCL